MSRTTDLARAFSCCFLLAACGGGASPPPASPTGTPTPSTAATTGAPDPAGGSGAATGPSTSAAPTAAPTATEPAYDDPTESAGTVALAPEVTKATPKSAFPKKKADDQACWQSVSPSGESKKDFDALTAACGTPTGLLEYVKPASGKLHHVKDKRDTYSVDLHKGYCYRYFAVADSSITDIDILVEKPGGALVADDKQNGPVAIIKTDNTWCMDDDAKYEFHIEIDGPGTGGYVFGIWTRPKP